MGWEKITINEVNRHMTFPQFLAQQLNEKLVHYHRIHMYEAYAAVEDSTGFVYALQIDLNITKTEINYQLTREFEGPYPANCPLGVRELLSPLDEKNPDHKYAIKWRERCLENLGVKPNV